MKLNTIYSQLMSQINLVKTALIFVLLRCNYLITNLCKNYKIMQRIFVEEYITNLASHFIVLLIK